SVREEIGTSGCFTNSDLCGPALNRLEGQASVLDGKPSTNIDEVSITRASGGPQGHKERTRCPTCFFWIPISKPSPRCIRARHDDSSHKGKPPSIAASRSP